MSGQHQFSRIERAAWWLVAVATTLAVVTMAICAFSSSASAFLGMRFNTGLCITALAVSLALTMRARERDPLAAAPVAARTLALFVVIFATATASQDFFQRDLGIDEMFIKSTDAAAGRMSLNSSLLLVLLAFGQAAGYRRPSLWFQVPILCAVAIALLSAAGYALGVSALFAIARDTAMAPITVITTLCLCAASLALYPSYGFTRLLLDPGPGSFAVRRMLPVIIGAPLTLGWLARLGTHYGLYDDAFGFAINVIVATIALVLVLVQSASNLNRIDADRQQYQLQIEKLNLELARRAELLQMSNKELEAFSYSVSHDLRAPIRHIGGFTDLLRKRATPQLDDKSQHYLQTISGAARRAGTLIDDLLAFSRMSRSKMDVAELDVGKVIDRVWQQLAPDREGRDVTIEIGKLPRCVGDAAMIELVFQNLLSNALKYSRRAHPARIEVGGNQTATDIEYWVRDNGVGFDTRYADKLFGVFQRLHTTEEFEGVGIGLANVKRIVVRHGGRVWADGEVDRGATFHFSLPITKLEGKT